MIFIDKSIRFPVGEYYEYIAANRGARHGYAEKFVLHEMK
jgi:hypothetical protein